MDSRKRCKNTSVDEKLFIRFQETENGGFQNRISVDRASYCGAHLEQCHCKESSISDTNWLRYLFS